MENKNCFVGIKKCGCLVAIVCKNIHEDDLKETLEEYMESDYEIKSMTIEEAKKKLKNCKCSESEK